MKTLLTLLTLFCAVLVKAALPDAVLKAVLSPAITDTTLERTWQLTTPETWLSSPTRVSELGGMTTSVQSGADHPSGWVKTELILTMPPQTDANPNPIQTFTLKATPVGVTPKTTLTFLFLNQAVLPPCSVRTWKGCPALVSDANDWYIIAQDPKARITRSDTDPVKTTLAVADCTTGKTQPVSRAVLLGEGPLPPEPPTE